MTRIVVVGGGAGGLELVTKLGHTLGRKGRAQITLVDRNASHLWKPLLHEVATGSMDEGVDALSYRAHARNHSFDFQMGNLEELDRDRKVITLAELKDEYGELLIPRREVKYDILVLAIGSTSNDFNTEGVKDHCIFLDSPEQANLFRTEMNNEFLKLHAKNGHGTVDIAIVGAGATGVELSAELHNAVKELRNYGFGDLDSNKLNVHLIEAGERILPALPPRISSAAHHELTKLGVNVRTSTMITKVEEDGLTTKDGEKIPAKIMVWAAGIKAPDFMKDIAGLETNRINQLVVTNTLQTTRDEDVFVIGDLAQCTQPDGSFVPPRAQAAHQMASRTFKNIVAKLNDRDMKPYVYKDHGSLVSLSRFSTVGSLMGNLTKGSMMVEGTIARVVYISLYRMHQMALHGMFKTALMLLVGRINRVLRPNLKLH
ncbi:NAD(P)/FAD-dependent oxidoreductase [Vibrio gazogenes]|uniref:NADH dehydrogenase n=1 Tax=Vibrio gazogenes DSM 21264 = NBRC 103151 TaxID=1123492 RepID=A0A1M5DTJ9_VIBGA|nr:NAD(P)/FAD-dependent oxidoreductase [Vibrio gazogenes]USP14869.1 NAD(P)/FAD-dependent oxidoreductase [Vibrio gazogenes]SHF70323.1 NADH dehydrogenase [Vibrio gazogenes DSM 21264] [Vibrio gazogenes DSM 21264 = NBRC 103151]